MKGICAIFSSKRDFEPFCSFFAVYCDFVSAFLFWTVWGWFSPIWLFGRQKQCFVGSQLGLTFLRSINAIWLVFGGCSAEKDHALES